MGTSSNKATVDVEITASVKVIHMENKQIYQSNICFYMFICRLIEPAPLLSNLQYDRWGILHGLDFYDLLTFLTEHAVTERHLCKDSIFLEGSGQHRACICRQALATQVQSGAQSNPALKELSHNTLLRLHTSLLTQAQVRLPEILHSGSTVSPFHARHCLHAFLLSSVTRWLEKNRFTGEGWKDYMINWVTEN